MPDGPYKVTDNSGSFTGRGWRLSGPTGFDVYADREEQRAHYDCRQLNIAYAAGHAAALASLSAGAVDLTQFEAACDEPVLGSYCDACGVCRYKLVHLPKLLAEVKAIRARVAEKDEALRTLAYEPHGTHAVADIARAALSPTEKKR